MNSKISMNANPSSKSESTKRIHAYMNRLLITSDRVKPNFDDHVKEVVLKYAHHPEDVVSTISYLDSMSYGCKYDREHIKTQIGNFKAEHAKSAQWNKNYQLALQQVRDILKPHYQLKVDKICSQSDLEDALPKHDTHAGYTFIETGLRSKGENLPGAYSRWKLAVQTAIRNGTFNIPILIGTRLQVSGAFSHDGERTDTFKQKTRMVNMVDMLLIITELQFSRPLQRWFSQCWKYAGGKNDSDLNDYITVNRQKYKNWISIDYSSYDQMIPGWMIRDAFDILKGMFSEASFEQFSDIWEVLVNDFVHKRILSPWDGLVSCHDGVPSGDMFTQIIDTVCNMIMIHTYMNSKHPSNRWDCVICGDDNLIFTDEIVDLDDLSGYIKRMFGITCHPDKCVVGKSTDYPIFLSREWMTEGAWRHPHELLAKVLYPERFRPYSKGIISPELIVYSYILAFPMGMKQLMDTERFKKENELIDVTSLNSAFKYQSGFYAYRRQYNGA